MLPVIQGKERDLVSAQIKKNNYCLTFFYSVLIIFYMADFEEVEMDSASEEY